MAGVQYGLLQVDLPEGEDVSVRMVANEDARVTYVVEETVTIVEEFRLNHGFVLIYLQLSVVLSLLAFFYVRRISKPDGYRPSFLHKLCCPLLTVLRWEGFDGVEPLYAIVLGCLYTVFCWKPSEEEEKEEQDTPEDKVYTRLVDAV